MTAVSPLAVPSIPAAPVVEVAWQGGEPTLMGLPFFRRAVELVDRYLRPGQSAVHTIQTNGINLGAEYGIEVAPGASGTPTANAREDD